MPRSLPLSALLFVPAVLGGPGPAPFAPQSEAVRELWLAPPIGTRVEHFVLEDAGGGTLGLARLLVGPAAGIEGVRLEMDTLFFAEQTRVVHTERLCRVQGEEPSQALIWREIRPTSGRTLLLEGTLGGTLRSSETVGGEVVRREHEDAAGAFLPLCLLEAARAGDPLEGTHPVFEPLACAFEPLAIELRVDRSTGIEEHVLELRRAGEPAGRFVFRSGSLVSWRLQEGGPLGRRVSRDDYERLLAEHVRTKESPEEAVAALRPAPAPR